MRKGGTVMKKIVKGRKYDTESATKIAAYEHGSRSQFEHFEEALFRKRSGEYFLWGSGGPGSKYAKFVTGENAWGAGESINPLTYEAARDWMERHVDADAYEAEFGEASEDGSLACVNVRVSSAAKTKLARAAARRGVSQSAVVEELLGTLED